MIKFIAILVLTVTCTAKAERFTFSYRTPDSLKITVEAESRDLGYRKAAKLCYNVLTKGYYPGEEEGLRIIDICANPTNYQP